MPIEKINDPVQRALKRLRERGEIALAGDNDQKHRVGRMLAYTFAKATADGAPATLARKYVRQPPKSFSPEIPQRDEASSPTEAPRNNPLFHFDGRWIERTIILWNRQLEQF
jgi:hypothetical protein